MDAIYRVEGHRVTTSPNAAGPWDPSMQHGSAPAALAVWAAETIPTAVPMHIARVTIELMRPVPVAPLTLESEALREGRGEWILLDAESWIRPDGAGLAMARLADVKGYFGRAVQSLVIEKR